MDLKMTVYSEPVNKYNIGYSHVMKYTQVIDVVQVIWGTKDRKAVQVMESTQVIQAMVFIEASQIIVTTKDIEVTQANEGTHGIVVNHVSDYPVIRGQQDHRGY